MELDLARPQDTLPEKYQEEFTREFQDPLDLIQSYLGESLRNMTKEYGFDKLDSYKINGRHIHDIGDFPETKRREGKLSLYFLRADSWKTYLSAEHDFESFGENDWRPGWRLRFEGGDKNFFQVTVDNILENPQLPVESYKRKNNLERFFVI